LNICRFGGAPCRQHDPTSTKAKRHELAEFIADGASVARDVAELLVGVSERLGSVALSRHRHA
jgi:hypothetical protein